MPRFELARARWLPVVRLIAQRLRSRYGVLTLVAAMLLAGSIWGWGWLAQKPAAISNVASGQPAIVTPVARAAVSAFAFADVLEGGCALSGGRERSCWTNVGASVTKAAAVESLVGSILRASGIPDDLLTAGAPRWLDAQIPLFGLSATDMVVPAGAVSLPVRRELAGDERGLNSRGALGAHWRLNWENHISRNASGYVVSESGREVAFSAGSGGEYLGPPGERIVIDARSGAPVRIRGDLTQDA
jgi:hypothetical protein